MRHRPWAALAVSLPLLLAATAAACGSDSGTGSDSIATDAPATTSAGTADSAGAGDAARSLEGQGLTLYSGRNEELLQPLIDQFEDETGAEVDVRYGSSAEVAAALLEEGDRTPADVFYSQEPGALGVLAKAGLLTPLPDEVVAPVAERFRPAGDNLWVGVTGRSRVIAYNPDLVADPPQSVLDLTDPAYEGQTGWVPANASFQAFITAFRISKGEEAARQWIEDMKANGAQIYESNDAVLQAVDRGDLPIGLINHYYWARLLLEVGGPENMTAQLVFPQGDDPGALVNASAVGLTTSGADNPAALALIEFLLSDEGQTYFATETFEYPLIEGVPDPEGVPALEELQGPQLDLGDLDSLDVTQQLLTDEGLLS